VKTNSVFALFVEHQRVLFPDEMFADLFPRGLGRPSVPADVMAAVVAGGAVWVCPIAKSWMW